MPSVPNWIAKAYIYWPRTGGEGSVAQICEWRATGTQVVVRIRPTGPEYRFRLDGLTMVGKPRYSGIKLLAPDDRQVITVKRADVVRSARAQVLGTIEQLRLQDSTDDAEAYAKKLTAVQDVITAALADLSEYL